MIFATIVKGPDLPGVHLKRTFALLRINAASPLGKAPLEVSGGNG
jgi:hypothetical protein